MEFLWEEIKKLLEMLTTEHSRWQTSEEDRRQELACARLGGATPGCEE
jgi:hypothetical protein